MKNPRCNPHLTPAQRFQMLVIPGDPAECWPWPGRVSTQGYGRLRIYGKDGMAHRLSWEIHRGPVPDGLTLDHLCRNRSCVNPNHLEPVTNAVNVLRGVGPSAKNRMATHCTHGHPFTEANTRITPEGHRSCRECAREHSARTQRGECPVCGEPQTHVKRHVQLVHADVQIATVTRRRSA